MTRPAAIPQALLDRQDAVERALREHVERSSAGALPLYRMMGYQLGWLDREGTEEMGPPPVRFHGAVCLEAAASARTPGAGDGADGPAAACAELVCQSATVHEDMQIGEPQADGREAVWWVWGPAQAINVGDGLHALARLAAFRMRERGLSAERTLAAVACLDSSALKYYEGRYMELSFQERLEVSGAQFLQMAAAKRGALLGGAAALGAYAAGAGDDAVEGFRAFGEQLGVALQIAEDVEAVWGAGQGSAGAGLLNRTKPYPAIYALEHATRQQRREIGEIYLKRVMEPDNLEGLRQVLDDAGAREHAQELAEAEAAGALGALARAGLAPEALERWRSIVDALVKSSTWRS